MSTPIKRLDFFSDRPYGQMVRARTWAAAWRMAVRYKASKEMRKIYRACMRDAAMDAVKLVRDEKAREETAA